MTNDPIANANQRVVQQLDSAITQLGIGLPGSATTDAKRRGLRAPPSGLEMHIVQRDGVLYLDEQRRSSIAVRRRRRASRAFGPGAEPIKTVRLATLERNQIGTALSALDEILTPNQGLKQVKDGALCPLRSVRTRGRILLFVHGTFSNCQNILDQLPKAPNGGDFLRWMNDYDQVLAFDHPTLAMNPLLNASVLADKLRHTQASIDIVCHSRGGLVSRWWLESFSHRDPAMQRAVFVAAPLNGTGLAAPPNIKGSLELLLNIGRGLSTAARVGSAVIPFMTVVAGLFQVFNTITSLLAKTPLVDAAVALVPGLAAMSRVSNNFELLQLRQQVEVDGRYFGVRSNFESEELGWQFWRAFRDLPQRAVSGVADTVFAGPNDLVVDTASMTNFQDRLLLPSTQILDYGTTSTVQHTNYFEQKETLSFIMDSLQAPA